jgi:rsbT antagonist protein RsbS
MRVPILRQGNYLIASIQSAVSDSDMIQLQDELPTTVKKTRATGVVIDVTALDVMDSFASRSLRAIAHTVKLCGAHMVIVGIQPDVAFAMVQLGMTLPDIETALDLDEGLAFLNLQTAGGHPHVR